MSYVPTPTRSIEALNHSLPLNVHTHSDYPEVNAFVDSLWDAYLQAAFPAPKGIGKRPKTPRKQVFKTLLLDLYVNWCTDPTLCTGISFDKKYYKANPRVNGLYIPESIIPMTKFLIEEGLLYYKGGVFVPGNPTDNKTSRIWPTAKLIDYFKSATFTPKSISLHKNKEVIIIRDKDNRIMNYKDEDFSHEPLVQWRKDLHAYNELLTNSFIDAGPLEEPIFKRLQPDGSERIIARVHDKYKFIRRTFSRGSTQYNGRYNGGWWESINEEERAGILINDLDTVEIDYSSMHPMILYGMEGKVPPTGDIYELAPLMGLDTKTQRKWIKFLVLFAINAKTEKDAFSAFRKEERLAQDGVGKLTNSELSVLLEAFKKRHPDIAHLMGKDKGIECMRIDSDITHEVVKHFTERRRPILTVHDSYIIPFDHTGELRSEMEKAFKKRFGFKPNLTQEFRGMDEARMLMRDPLTTFDPMKGVKRTKRTNGYRKRWKEFREWIDSK